MTVAAKCNISTLVLEKLGTLIYGFSCKNNNCAIIENYIEYLQCPQINLIVCNPDNCSNEPTIFNCDFKIAKISYRFQGENDPVNDCDIVFYIDNSDFIGGEAPYTYQWNFEADDFNLVGNLTSPELKLIVKPGKLLNLLVTKINVTVTDKNGCVAYKQCWLTPQGMQCNKLFAPCPNPGFLVVFDNFIDCARANNLKVS